MENLTSIWKQIQRLTNDSLCFVDVRKRVVAERALQEDVVHQNVERPKWRSDPANIKRLLTFLKASEPVARVP